VTGVTLPDTLRLGPVALIVSDLDRSIAWYERSLGLRLHARADGRAELGDGSTLVLTLEEEPGARPAGRHAGLYHYALLYPARAELARAVVRLAETRTPVDGASDHGTHEAIYLADADGNGIELAADRPRSAWPSKEVLFAGGPAPLNLDALLATVADEPARERVSGGLRVGHVHLHVGDIERGLGFYRDVLGFALEANLGSAAFVAAGGYHHHVGFNVWRGRGVGPAPEHTVGLRHWTIELERADDVADVRARVAAAGLPPDDDAMGFTTRDPWRIAVRVVSR
jgi:catechol 2,3-dioxygenase